MKTQTTDEHLKSFKEEVRRMNLNSIKECGALTRCSLCGKHFDDEVMYISAELGAIICGECYVSCLLATRGKARLIPSYPILSEGLTALSKA